MDLELDSRALLNMNYMNYQAQQQHMTMAYGDGLSLSESSVCSSIDIRSPDIHPVPDTIGMPSGMVAQAITHNILSSPTISHHCNSNMMTSQQTSNTNPVLAWPSSTTTDIAVTNSDLMINHQMPLLKTSSDAMTHNEDLYTPHLYESMNSDQSVKTHRSIFHLAADVCI